MDKPFPPFFHPLVASETLEDLDLAVRDALGGLLPPGSLRQSSFLVLHEPELSCGLVVNQVSLQKSRYCRPWRFSPEFMESLKSSGTVVSLPLTGVPGLFAGPIPESLAEAAGPLSLLLLLRSEQTTWGAWLLGLNTSPASPNCADLAASLETLAAVVGMVFGPVFHNHLVREQHQQTVQLHEAMLKILVGTNREDLLARLLGFLLRQYGLERVAIALIDPQSQVLRSELHTGFPSSMVPFSAAMEMRQNFFVWAADRGEVLIFECACRKMPDGLPVCESGQPPERAVLIPLRLGSRPMGLIYGDQPRHDGRPLFADVLVLLSRLAGCALENLNLRTNAELRAETDPLTGLHNRFFLDRVLEMEIPRVKRYNQPISLLMIDLCDFKQTNDAYGHQFGDYILKETAAILEVNVRRPDFVIRFGGDEFLVLMVNTSAQQAQLVRERIERAFVERNRLQSDEKMMIRISIGLRSADAANIEGLIYDADMEMYAQKARQKRHQLIKALLQGSLDRIEAADKVVGSLCNMLYKKAPYYSDHARRVAHLALIVARRLGLPADEIESLALAALLHDVGKVSLPTEIIQKPAALTQSERLAIRHHSALGEEFFRGIEHLEPLRPLIRAHHERFDGVIFGDFPGYPDGLGGERIQLGGRILKLAESVDAMLHDRPYRRALTLEVTIATVRKEAGKSFDPRLTRILLDEPHWHANLGDMQAIRALLNLDQD